MNIEELDSLGKWISVEIKAIEAPYKQIMSILQNNTNQNAKQPLEAPLHSLKDLLSTMPMNKLTIDQTKMLGAFGVLNYTGHYGVEFLDKIEHQKELDPATAFAKIQEAVKKLAEALSRANSISQAFINLPIESMSPVILEQDRCLVRVQFQNLASIENVVEWESWSKKWVAISRGIGMSVGEAPENVHIVGASRGSLILDLATTAAFASLLTGIINMVIRTAKGLLELENIREDLRHRKLLNKKTEAGLKEEAVQKKKDAVDNIADEARKQILPKNLDGDELTKLKSSIKELIEFHKKGGGLDVIPPKIEHHVEENEAEETELPSYTERLTLQENVEELRELQEEIKRLTHESSEDK